MGAAVVAPDCPLVVPPGCAARGRDVDEHAEFTVVSGAGDAPSDIGSLGGLEQVSGSAAAHLDIVLPRLIFRAGEIVGGEITIVPTRDLPDGDVRVCWQRHRYSHPRTRTPGPGEVTHGRPVVLDKRIPLRVGVPVRLALRAGASRGRGAHRKRGQLVAGLVCTGQHVLCRLHQSHGRAGATADRGGQRSAGTG
jgi:hypothetical protein